MKHFKRVLCLLLAACLLTAGAQAATTLSASPYPKIECAQTDATPVGTIRYVSQVSAAGYGYYSDYWGRFASYSGSECFTACISMALSYLGIDATPLALGNYWLSQGYTAGTPFSTTEEDVDAFGATEEELPLAEAMARYRSGNGRYSPPIIHLTSYSARGHYVMVVGQVTDSEYIVLDPAAPTSQNHMWKITVSGSTVTHPRGVEYNLENATQYYNPNAYLHSDGSSCPSAAFTDVPEESHWAHASIDYCMENDLMLGTSETSFAPDASMTRAMVVSVLYRAAGSPETAGETPFTDLTQAWYADAVAWAYENDVVSGVSATAFAPNEPVTREQLAAILYRYAAVTETPDKTALDGFDDADEVSGWAREAACWAVETGLLRGVSATALAPGDTATRAQVAVLLQRFLTA